MNRLTITLPDDLHAMARAYAVANRKSISKAIVDLLRRGRESGVAPDFQKPVGAGVLVHPVSGFPIVEGDGRPFDSDTVRRMEDDEDIRHFPVMEPIQEDSERNPAR